MLSSPHARDESTPVVSVILIVRNGMPRLVDQLEALGGQREAPAFEVLVVDNGSQDETVAAVQRWIAADPVAPQAARLIRAGERPGIPYARNQGALASRGALLAFCDHDDIVSPTWVAELAAGSDRADLIGGARVQASPDGAHPEVVGTGLNPTHFLPYVSGCNFAVRRDAYFAVGGMDESLPRYGFDDVEFSWRLQVAGRSIASVPDAVVLTTPTGNVASVSKKYRLAKGRMLMAARYPEFDGRPFSYRYCLSDLARTAAALPVRLVRPRMHRRREVVELIVAAGRLAGYVHYHARPERMTPRFVGPDPRAREGLVE